MLINKSCLFEYVLMNSNSTPIVKLMFRCTSQYWYWLCHQNLFHYIPQRQTEKIVLVIQDQAILHSHVTIFTCMYISVCVFVCVCVHVCNTLSIDTSDQRPKQYNITDVPELQLCCITYVTHFMVVQNICTIPTGIHYQQQQNQPSRTLECKYYCFICILLNFFNLSCLFGFNKVFL